MKSETIKTNYNDNEAIRLVKKKIDELTINNNDSKNDSKNDSNYDSDDDSDYDDFKDVSYFLII